VFVSAGAINSPQVLMFIGYRPKAHLAEYGITTVVELLGGTKFTDPRCHLCKFVARIAIVMAVSFGAIPRLYKAAFDYLLQRKGILSSNVSGKSGGFESVQSPHKVTQHIQYHFLPANC